MKIDWPFVLNICVGMAAYETLRALFLTALLAFGW